MRRPLRQLVAISLLWLALQPPPLSPRDTPPIITPSATPVKSWDVLRDRLDQDARFYTWASQLPPPPTTAVVKRPERSLEVVYGTGACGGDLPPCSVLRCESGGNLVAQNPNSTASGKWQILDSTWAGYGGYERAMEAPEDVQDDRAREIYANGAGRHAWVC